MSRKSKLSSTLANTSNEYGVGTGGITHWRGKTFSMTLGRDDWDAPRYWQWTNERAAMTDIVMCLLINPWLMELQKKGGHTDGRRKS
jgi:hypothetical protein